MNLHRGFSLWPWIVCADPLGKYQMSPTSRVSTWFLPSSSTAEISTEPAYTYPHSAFTSVSLIRSCMLSVTVQLTTRCQCNSRRAPFFRCCCAPEMVVLDGRSVMTCSRTHPPLRSRVLESEKLHLMFGTSPLSVLCAPRLSGFWRSNCLFVPPELSISFWGSSSTDLVSDETHEPRIGAPLPFASIGSPSLNCWRLSKTSGRLSSIGLANEKPNIHNTISTTASYFILRGLRT